MSSGSRVRRLGTIAMSSNRYARRPDLPMPISTSAVAFLQRYLAGLGADRRTDPTADAAGPGRCMPDASSGVLWRSRTARPASALPCQERASASTRTSRCPCPTPSTRSSRKTTRPRTHRRRGARRAPGRPRRPGRVPLGAGAARLPRGGHLLPRLRGGPLLRLEPAAREPGAHPPARRAPGPRAGLRAGGRPLRDPGLRQRLRRRAARGRARRPLRDGWTSRESGRRLRRAPSPPAACPRTRSRPSSARRPPTRRRFRRARRRPVTATAARGDAGGQAGG